MSDRGDSWSSGQASGQPVVEQARQKAGEVVDQARQQIQSKLGDQKDRAADGLGQVADALRQTGQQLREHQQEGISQYAESAAAQVERIAGYLREQDIERLVSDADSLARPQPVW